MTIFSRMAYTSYHQRIHSLLTENMFSSHREYTLLSRMAYTSYHQRIHSLLTEITLSSHREYTLLTNNIFTSYREHILFSQRIYAGLTENTLSSHREYVHFSQRTYSLLTENTLYDDMTKDSEDMIISIFSVYFLIREWWLHTFYERVMTVYFLWERHTLSIDTEESHLIYEYALFTSHREHILFS